MKDEINKLTIELHLEARRRFKESGIYSMKKENTVRVTDELFNALGEARLFSYPEHDIWPWFMGYRVITDKRLEKAFELEY